MRSEALRAQQRDQQVAAKRERDDEAEDGFDHGGLRHSRLTASA